MSKIIDEKVVSMQFDNKNFENNVKTTLGTLDKLKQSLNLTGAAKGLNNISDAANKVDMSKLDKSVETIKIKFSALEVMAITALANITDSALNAGKRITKALTIDPIRTGFQEYETQINAVQTILANTSSKGTTLDQVNKALDELNHYADLTIYNFTEMTRNIGTFTAAGVDLDTSVQAIKGIANLAAVSGSTSQQASTAMYQLSQALAAGTVKLQDWNSVVNAGMGGQVFQDALKETARVHGIAIDKMIKDEGSFRETLQKGWLTSDILTETLSKFTGDLNEEQLRTMGYTEEQIKGIIKMGQTANDAATKVKTFTQLWDTLKEAAQSGWTQSWKIIIGDFEEAKELLTSISDTVSTMINSSAESRNNLLQGWKDLGGRTSLIESLKNSFEAIQKIIEPISEAFREIFPSITAKQLYNFTDGIRKLTENMKISDETANKLKRTFKGLFSIADILKKVLMTMGNAITSVFASGGISSIADLFLSFTASIGDFFTSLDKNFSTSDLSESISNFIFEIGNTISKASDSVSGFSSAFSIVGENVSKALIKIWDGFKTVFTWITDNVSGGDIFAGLAGSGLLLIAKKLSDVFSKLKDVINELFGGEKESLDIGKKFANILDSVHESLQSFSSGIKVASLVGIATSIAILSSSLKSISQLKTKDITKSLIAMSTMFAMLNRSFKSLSNSLKKFESKGIIKAGTSLILVSSAIKILSSALQRIAKLSFNQISKGLVGIGVGLTELIISLKKMNNIKVKPSTSIALIALAKSCEILAKALVNFGSMSWDEIGRGLTAMGGALGEFMTSMAIMNKVGGSNSFLGSISLLIAVESLDEIAENLKKLGSLSWDEIGKGLTAMGGALLELSSVTGILGKMTKFSGLLGAGTIVIAVQSLDKLADALQKFGFMSWNEIARGLVAMGGALGELSFISGILGKISKGSGLLGAATIVLSVQSLKELADSLQKFGFMSWDEIAHGLVGMGGALGELAIVSGALGKLAGLSGLLGSGSILLGVQGLEDLADALQKFGSMDWDEIGKGLVAMGGALGELAIVSGALGTLAPLGGLLGSGSILLGVQGLEDLADSLQKFGLMDWDEIGKGLAAMGGALGELAIGGFLSTLSIIGSYSIATIAEPLGTLADSIKKWSNVTLPSNLGSQLATLSGGVLSFTLSGFGADALATTAPALGVMADSIKKWSGVSIPEGLGAQLSSLSGGIFSFTLSGFGADALSIAAPAIGSMAESIKKWSGVSIPEGLEEGLKQIANGIEAFTFAFVGGWSLDSIISPLSLLAESIKKWNGISIPEGLEKGLKRIANGIKAFTFAFVGSWSLDGIIGPLGSLATAVKKWNEVSIPEGIFTQLDSFAESIKKFANISDISSAVDSAQKIANAVAKLSGIDFVTISSGLNGIVTSLSKFSSINSSLSGVGEVIANNIISPLKNISKSLSNTGSDVVKSIANGMKNSSGNIISASNSIVSKIISTINGKSNQLNSSGAKLSSELANGLKKNISKFKNTMTSLLTSVTSSIRGYYDNFYSAGSYLVKGFKNGISDNSYKASAAAKAMASAAAKAAKAALKIASPSKVFYKIGDFSGMGFINALKDSVAPAFNAGSNIADSARQGLSKAMSRVNDILTSDVESQPTIRPVIDLSDISDGTQAINDMFNINPSVGVMSNLGRINNLMSRSQNDSNEEVVTAINRLRKDLGNLERPSYNINGITYDDGSNISEAIETLVRAAKIERRR